MMAPEDVPTLLAAALVGFPIDGGNEVGGGSCPLKLKTATVGNLNGT